MLTNEICVFSQQLYSYNVIIRSFQGCRGTLKETFADDKVGTGIYVVRTKCLKLFFIMFFGLCARLSVRLSCFRLKFLVKVVFEEGSF